MTYQDTKSLQLFDLLAREWAMACPVKEAVFNNSQTIVAFAGSDGSISIISTQDMESPNSRVHHAVDTGVQTIQPRKSEIPPLIKVAFTQQRTSSLVPYGKTDFVFGTANGKLNVVNAQGDVAILELKMQGPVVAVTSSPDGCMLSCAAGNDILICREQKLTNILDFQSAEPVVALAFSPDGRLLSVAHKTGISVWKVADNITRLKDYPLEMPVNDLCWSDDGHWLAGTMAANGFVLIDTRSNRSKQFSDFPSPVDTLSFSPTENAIATSGAFRAAAWSLTQLENGQNNSGALRSGKPGLVAVDSVAASPNRNLLAVGYENGLLCLTRVGHEEEMMLAQDNGVGIPVLSWSRNGEYLAIGKSDGKAALIEFPRGMFK